MGRRVVSAGVRDVDGAGGAGLHLGGPVAGRACVAARLPGGPAGRFGCPAACGAARLPGGPARRLGCPAGHVWWLAVAGGGVRGGVASTARLPGLGGVAGGLDAICGTGVGRAVEVATALLLVVPAELRTSLEQVLHELDEFGRLEGLGEKGVDADIEAALDLGLRTGADDGERQLPGPGIGTKPRCRPQPVEPRHDDIQGDDIGPHLMHDVQTLGTVGGGHDLETLQLEVDPDQLPDDLVVVHNKHPAGRAWHNSRVGRPRGPRPGFPHFRPVRASRVDGAPGKRFMTTTKELVGFYPSAQQRGPRPRSSGDRATASGAVCAGSNPAGGTLYEVPIDPVTSGNAAVGVFVFVQTRAAGSSRMSGSVDEAWTGS